MSNIIKDKSFALAVKGVLFYKQMIENKREFILTKQMVRSITSVGANIREAVNGQTKPDFIHKLSIAQKECDESMYWLELLKATEYISNEEFDSVYYDCEEVLKITKSIIITSKNNIKNS